LRFHNTAAAFDRNLFCRGAWNSFLITTDGMQSLVTDMSSSSSILLFFCVTIVNITSNQNFVATYVQYIWPGHIASYVINQDKRPR